MIFINYFRNVNYQLKVLFLLILDYALIFTSSFLTEILYLGYLPKLANALFLYIFIYIGFYTVSSYFFQVYKQLNRFFGIYYIQKLFSAISVVTVFLISFKFIYEFRYLNLNFIILQSLIFFILISTMRLVVQRLYFHRTDTDKNKFNSVIFGAGSEGINLYRRLKINSDYNFLAFVDEDITKIGRYADELQVYPLKVINF